jgi:hypothetical protein
MYLNRRSECLKDWMEILALGMSRSCEWGPAILQSSAFFATMVGVIEENGVDVLCFVGFDHGFCKSCIGRLAGFCIS